MIFDRGAAQGEAMVAAQQADGLGRFGPCVLNRLCLIENHVIEDLILEVHSIAAESSVGGEDRGRSRRGHPWCRALPV